MSHSFFVGRTSLIGQAGHAYVCTQFGAVLCLSGRWGLMHALTSFTSCPKWFAVSGRTPLPSALGAHEKVA